MRIGVLGRTSAAGATGPVDLGGPKQRALLAALALHRGRAVPVDTLVDLLWGATPPAGAAGTLQSYVAGLRRALEPDRAARTAAQLLVTEAPGYALRVADLDVDTFERTVERDHLAVAAAADALCRAQPPVLPEAAAELAADLDRVLASWRGTPFADLPGSPAVDAERARLEELRLLAAEDRAALALTLGDTGGASARLESLTREHPLRERLWALYAVALTRSGRQADALAALDRVRRLLDEELGIEPGRELRSLQTAILRQDSGLRAAPAAASEPVAAVRPAARTASRWATEWPLVGREAELAALVRRADQMLAGDTGDTGGAPVFAAITGEPGIGKSRLAAELAAYATRRGATVVAGRCSQDDGAPALWPWATVLRSLGSALPSLPGSIDAPDPDDDSRAAATRFRAWETVVDTVLAAARAHPLVVVLDDLHWADASTLRVLRLLTESDGRWPHASAGEQAPRLLVVATWRDHPPPSGPLAEVAEALGRRHALRLQLDGLTTDDVARVVAAIAEATPSPAQADALRRRTDGNPFFLVEYSRLARDRGSLGGLLTEASPPLAVQEVVARRLERLPATTAEVLRTASVLGREFDLATLARTVVGDPDDDGVLDALDPALAAGLVGEDGVDRFRFTHALVRDTVLAGLSRSRAARLHARAAAALDGSPGHEADTARHWCAAGPRFADRAWRACRTAADAALRVHAHEEVVDLLVRALDAQAADPASTERDRFELLITLAEGRRRAGDWVRLREVAHEALALARRLDDVELLTRAGVLTTSGALWQSARHGDVDEVVAGALREVLSRLPDGDSTQRCRSMLALAGEIYYGSTPQEREALAEEAVAMARRLDEPHLLLWALLSAAVAIWRAATAERRLELTEEAVQLAGVTGDGLSLAAALTLRAVACGEVGLVDRLDRGVAQARAQTRRVRHVYCELVLDSLEVPWQAMRGRPDEVARLIEHSHQLGQSIAIPQFEEAIAGMLTMQLMWSDRHDEMAAVLEPLAESTYLPVSTSLMALLCRAGRVADAAAYGAAHQADVSRAMDQDTWFSPMAWSMAAEAAWHLHDPALAARAYERLLPLAGRPGGAGSGTAIGPVDWYLALAAAATGERGLAARHADRAEELCRTWRIPLAARWTRDQRDRFGL